MTTVNLKATGRTLERVTVRSKAAVCLYFEPLVGLARAVKRLVLKRAAAPSIRKLEWVADIQVQELIALRRAVDKMAKAVGDTHPRGTSRTFESKLVSVGALVDRIEDAWVKRVAETVVEKTVMMLEGLARPVALYRGETELYRVLTDQVDSLSRGETVFAVCTAKSWDALSVREYLQANERAVHRGVVIARLFYELDDPHVIEVARKQASIGVAVRLLRQADLAALNRSYHIPLDLGLAIINGKTVIMHSGLGSSAYACRFECAHLASLIRSQFGVVERLAERIEDVGDRRPHNVTTVRDIGALRS
jgi:hypothetical protein